MKFGLIGEGVTDHAVINSLLAGAFDDQNVEARPFQPATDATSESGLNPFGGWVQVLMYLASPKFEEAFQVVDYVIVQIDTDHCEDAPFNVPVSEGGMRMSTEMLIARVVENIRARITEPVWANIGTRVIFAIAVDSTECWLLPIYGYDKGRTRESNCLEHLNRALRKRNEHAINPDNKNPRLYEHLSKPFTKQKDLNRYRKLNRSLDIFLSVLDPIAARQVS